MNIGKVHFLWKIKITVITTNVSLLDIEKTSQGVYTVNNFSNFFLVWASTLNGFKKFRLHSIALKNNQKKGAYT